MRSAPFPCAVLPVLSVLVCTPEPVHAQVIRERFQVWGMDEGLTQSSVHAVLEDRQGFLWLGTTDGLHRFDGHGFETFRQPPQSDGTVPSNYIRSLYQDEQEIIWLGTEDGALSGFDPATESFQAARLPVVHGDRVGDSTDAVERSAPILSVVQHPAGNLLLATTGGVVWLDPGRASARTVVAEGAASALHVDDRGLLWVGHADGSLLLVELGDAFASESPWPVVRRVVLDAMIRDIEPGPSGSLWVGTFGAGVYRIDQSNGRVLDRLLDAPSASGEAQVFDLLPDVAGILWIATSNGLDQYDPRLGRLTRHVSDPTSPATLPHDRTLALTEDRSGVLWIGTWDGLASLPPTRRAIEWWSGSASDTDSPGIFNVVSLFEAPGGQVWAGTFGSGLFRVDRDTREVVHYEADMANPLALSDPDVFWLDRDSGGHLWMATRGGGVNRLDPETGVFRRWWSGTDAEEGIDEANSVFIDHRGIVWAGTLSSGLMRLDPESDAFVSAAGRGWSIGATYAWAISQHDNGELWVGTVGAGVFRISADRNEAVRYSVASHGLSSDAILTLLVGPDGLIWIGTEGAGLNRLDPITGQVRVYDSTVGLPHDHVVGLLADDDGLLWVSTNGGLARLDPTTDELWVLGEAAGLQGNRFYANAAFKNERGELFFGGPDGFNIIDPSRLVRHQTPPSVVLTGFAVNNQEWRPRAGGRSVQLAHDQNFFAFSFAALDFGDVSLNRYRYMLDGLDGDWIDNGPNGRAEYRSVPPGRYNFRVSARNSEGLWREDALVIPLRIRPPYYQTWWFRLLVVATIAAGVAAAYTYEIRRRLKVQQMRLDIASTLHDDIGGNIGAIGLWSQRASRQLAEGSQASQDLERVKGLVSETALAVREVIWVAKTDYDTVEALVKKIRESAESILGGVLALRFNASVPPGNHPIGMELRQDIYFLFKEALTNARKHSGGSEVSVDVSYASPDFCLVIEDDGQGYDPERVTLGEGLKNMERRATKHGGSVQYSSGAGGGTRVEFHVSVK